MFSWVFPPSNGTIFWGPQTGRHPFVERAQGRWDGLAQRRAGLPAPGTLRAAALTMALTMVFESHLF